MDMSQHNFVPRVALLDRADVSEAPLLSLVTETALNIRNLERTIGDYLSQNGSILDVSSRAHLARTRDALNHIASKTMTVAKSR